MFQLVIEGKAHGHECCGHDGSCYPLVTRQAAFALALPSGEVYRELYRDDKDSSAAQIANSAFWAPTGG
jgi:hypothetical protein